MKKVGGPMGKSGWAKMRAVWAEAHPAITLIDAMVKKIVPNFHKTGNKSVLSGFTSVSVL